MSKLAPKEVKRISEPDNSGLQITWQDENTNFYPSELLRSTCPCATCMELRGSNSHQKPLQPKTGINRLQTVSNPIEVSLSLEKVWLVGNYALGIAWQDGHNTGIYPFEYLQEIVPTDENL